MADIFTKKKRSEIMSKIRGKETSIERTVFSELRKREIYFQKHYRLRNRKTFTIDIALPRKKIAVFVDGDFWHGYAFARRKNKLPKKYWVKKIEDNIRRDKRNRAKLRREGWRVLRVWEHEIQKNTDKTMKKIGSFLDKS